MNTDFIKKEQYYIDLVNNYLKEELKPQDPLYDIVIEAMNYSVFAGGKRIRPVIMMEFSKICGGKEEDILPFAAAIEMIHTYSLIHDDLPCVDNDDFRRGKETNHKKFGETIALFAGDGLLSLAFETASKSKSKNALECIGILAKQSGVSGMLGGQTIDKEYENKEIDLKTLIRLHNLKTGALIKACGEIGVLCAGGSVEKQKAAIEFCEKLGLAFQIQDDILDVTGDFSKLGKKVGSDMDNNKNTFVTLNGLEKSKDEAVKLTNQAIEALNLFNESEFLINLAKKLLNRDN